VTRRGAAALVASLAGLAAATFGLFLLSRGKWSDPLIDSGREWIVPDALARGELLYRDVVYWFGPLTPYFQAGFLRVFGSGFGSLVLAGAVSGLAALGAFYAALRRVTSRKDAAVWTALAIPVLVFMPNAGGALLGMGYRIWHAAAFALAAIAIASRRGRSHSGAWVIAAGACAGLAGLCRTEWGLAAIVAVGLSLLLRSRYRGRGVRDAGISALGFVIVFGGGLGGFLWRAGPRAVLGDGHVLLTGLPEETRHFLVAFSGLADWRRGAVELIYSAAMWTGIVLLATLMARPRGAGRRGPLKMLAAVLVVVAGAALAGGAGGAVLFSAAPLVSLAGLLCGLARRRGTPAAALAASGLLGFLLSYRRPFHIGDSAYVAPALLLAFVCAAGLLQTAVACERVSVVRAPTAAAYRWIVAAFVVLAFAGRAWQYASIEGMPIEGTSGMISARPELAREIEELGQAIRRGTRGGDGLIVFPEGELLNFLSGRPNPIRHKLYLPGYLTEENEPAVLAELERAQPAAVVLWRRPTSEYARSLFGKDYGRRVGAWIASHYRLVPFRAAGAPPRSNPRFLLGLREDP
jgi:hypothetical protein